MEELVADVLGRWVDLATFDLLSAFAHRGAERLINLCFNGD
jgi:hypothetical protein